MNLADLIIMILTYFKKYWEAWNSPANIYMVKVNNQNTGKNIQSWQQKHQNYVNNVVLVFLLQTLNIFHTFF